MHSNDKMSRKTTKTQILRLKTQERVTQTWNFQVLEKKVATDELAYKLEYMLEWKLDVLTLSQTPNFRLCQTQRVGIRQFQI